MGNNTIPSFDGPFKDILPDYIRYKRSLGYKYSNKTVYLLKKMDSFFRINGYIEPTITRNMYEKWTCVCEGEAASTTKHRRIAINGLIKYLISIGQKDIYNGTDDMRVFHDDFVPYIYTEDQIRDMFRVLEKQYALDPSYANGSFLMMVRMFYCCGFRKTELLELELQDIDFPNGKITILHGKNNVSRIVVASDSLRDEMIEYKKRYFSYSNPDTKMFHGINTARYTDQTLYRRYQKLMKEAGIPKREDGKYPRIHDLRHTFCVRSLESMEKKGMDIYTTLPLLAKYLGHKHIRDTEYYLRFLDEHYDDVLDKATKYCPGLFPEIKEAQHEE